MLAEFEKIDGTRENLKKIEKQKKIIYQKIAIVMSMKNLNDITKDKLEIILRKSDSFSDGELDLVFGKSTVLKEESSNFFKDLDYEDDETPAYLKARELKDGRERKKWDNLILEYI